MSTNSALLPPMKWNAWGDPNAAKPLSDGIRALLKQALGVDGSPAGGPEIDEVRVRPSALTAADRDALAAIVGAEFVLDDDRARLLHAGGKSTLDLLRRKDTEQDAPDAVLVPADEDQIAAILRQCSERRIAVVPFGGGTSVVGGLDPERDGFTAVVSLDLRRLNELHSLDEVSGEAVLGAGVTGPDAERLLGERGFSLGHFPQSFEFATIGGFAATRSSGQDSAGYGRFNDMIRGIRAVTPAGVLDLGRAPESAAGPDLRQLLIGSEGVFGVITQVRLRVHPAPECTRYEAWSFPDFARVPQRCAPSCRPAPGPPSSGYRTRPRPASTSPPRTASASRASPAAAWRSPCSRAPPSTRRADTPRRAQCSRSTAGRRWERRPARAWEHGRFSAPYLRDSLLAAGALCETLETATTWSNLPALKAAVTQALTSSLAESGTPALVLCHISHVYPTGASLYFTVVAGQRGNPIDQWRAAKKAATRGDGAHRRDDHPSPRGRCRSPPVDA